MKTSIQPSARTLFGAAVLLLAAVAGAQGAPKAGAAPKYEKAKLAPDDVVLVVIVHPGNPTKDVSLGELREIMRLDTQFWSDRSRVTLYLPKSRSVEYGILRDLIYKMSRNKLGKYWTLLQFSGKIPTRPSYAPSARAAGVKVRKKKGGISVVRLGQVPKGVKVLTIDGKHPDQVGYPLVGKDPKLAPKKTKP